MKIDYGPLVRYGPNGIEGRATLCFSVDFDVTDPSRSERNRKGTFEFLQLSEQHRVPLTWAICGNTAERDMKSYQAISNFSGRQELGIHTYSHIDAAASTKADFGADVQRCLQVLNLPNPPKTFIFPWNREAHFDVLRQFGFRTYRGASRAIGAPVLHQGLWNVRPVYYIDQKSSNALSLMKAFVDFCIEKSTVCHFWSHPWSVMGGEKEREMLQTLESLFAYLNQRCVEGRLVLDTMGGIASLMDFTAFRPEAEVGSTAGVAL